MAHDTTPPGRLWRAIARTSGVLALLAIASAGMAPARSPVANPIEALIEKGTLAMRTSPDDSKQAADQALELLKQHPDPDLEIRARLLICDYESERDTAAAQREIAAATALLSQAKRQGLRAGILDCGGETLEHSRDNTKAVAQYTEAVSVATVEHDDEMLAMSLFSR